VGVQVVSGGSARSEKPFRGALAAVALTLGLALVFAIALAAVGSQAYARLVADLPSTINATVDTVAESVALSTEVAAELATTTAEAAASAAAATQAAATTQAQAAATTGAAAATQAAATTQAQAAATTSAATTAATTGSPTTAATTTGTTTGGTTTGGGVPPGHGPLLRATLIGYDEVPSLSTPGRGSFTAQWNPRTQTIAYTLSYTALRGAAIQAHIHFSQPGVNGGISAFLCGGGDKPACPLAGGTVNGTIDGADILGPVDQGIAPGAIEDLVRAMQNGYTYANVHSSMWAGGEIRGQIREPASTGRP
jgi:hypothetical protein